MKHLDWDGEESSRGRRWLVGLALGVLLAVWALPASRTLARGQLRWLFAPPGLELDPETAARAAVRHPGDYPLQLASALRATRDPAALRTALAPYAELPSARASVLRVACRGLLLDQRDEEYLVTGAEVPHPAAGRQLNTPKQLAALEEDAAAGERLDPQNGFFPMMRAVILFAGRRDREALVAFRRAGEKREWQDYAVDEATSAWRLGDVAGREDAIHHAAWTFGVLLPHYAEIRAASRVALYYAIQAEAAGRVEEGLTIRRALSSYGGAMRDRCRVVIGSLVGVALQKLAMTRPGGGPPAKRSPGMAVEVRQQANLEAYTAYLERIGHPEAAEEARADSQAWRQVRAVATQASHDDIYNGALRSVVGWWIADLLLLSNIAWMLALGGLAALLARLPLLRTGAPLPASARWAIASAVLAGTTGGVLIASGMTTPGALAAALALPVALCALARRGDSLPRFLGIAAATLAGLTAAGFLCYLLSRGLMSLLDLATSLYGSEQPENPPAALSLTTWAQHGGQTIILLGSALVPALAALTLGLASLVLRVPLVTGLVRAFRRAALPVTCLLVLLYGSFVLATTRPEARLNHALEQTIRNEGHYLADRAGLPWPGASRR
jgi:hypothetical protein